MKIRLYVILLCTIVIYNCCKEKQNKVQINNEEVFEYDNESGIDLNVESNENPDNFTIIYDSLKNMEDVHQTTTINRNILFDDSKLRFVTFDLIDDVIMDSFDETSFKEDEKNIDISNVKISNFTVSFFSKGNYPSIASTVEELKFNSSNCTRTFLGKLNQAKENGLLFYQGKLELWYLSKDSSIYIIYPINGASLEVTKKLNKKVEMLLQ